jgi:plasmid maintenance system killer protein
VTPEHREKLSDMPVLPIFGNWRVTFRFEDGDVVDVDYVDYH